MSGMPRQSVAPATSQKRKRNHWVPQSYLRTFAADEKRQKIWRFSKIGGPPELKPIDKVAVKFYLYTPNSPSGRDYSFEERLSSLEQLFGNPVWDQACHNFIDLNDDINRKGIALLAAVMYLRNPLQLETTHQMHQFFLRLLSEDPELPDEIEINGVSRPIDHSSWPAYRDASEDDIRRIWLDQVRSAGWFAELLMKMRWSVLFTDNPTFITCDHPVIVAHPSMKFRGLTNPDTVVFFPLSPTRLLVMDNLHDQPASQYYPLKVHPGSLHGIIFRGANEHFFSSRDPDHVCAEMIEDHDRWQEQQSMTT